jgi:3D (Asp-Asp-Asp) domain-containing protein
MVKTVIAGLLIAASMTVPAHNKDSPKEEWVDAGTYRITTYCQYCNEVEGFQTASGKRLEYGQVAMNGVPFGTKISIEGEVFEVTDRVGVGNTVDIFIPSDKGYCACNYLEHKNVRIKRSVKK